MKVFQETR